VFKVDWESWGAPSYLLPPLPYHLSHNINVAEGAQLKDGGLSPPAPPPYFKHCLQPQVADDGRYR